MHRKHERAILFLGGVGRGQGTHVAVLQLPLLQPQLSDGCQQRRRAGLPQPQLRRRVRQAARVRLGAGIQVLVAEAELLQHAVQLLACVCTSARIFVCGACRLWGSGGVVVGVVGMAEWLGGSKALVLPRITPCSL